MTWTPSTTPPDADTTVLIHCPDADEPVWLGWFDGENWYAVDSSGPLKVTHWAPMPEPPAAKPARKAVRP